MKIVEEKILKFLEQHDLLQASNTFIVGFSGGYDSLCLLDVLHNLSLKYGFKLVACHLNHNWRGNESSQEQETACKYCSDKNIEFYTKILSSDLPKTELEARNQRYEFFKEAIHKYSANALFTGHTFTDNAETVLYRILKGTGIKGLRGILEYRDDFVCSVYRPMLNITRNETIKYCEEKDLSPNIDSSNENIHYLRNRIRKNLMPELYTYNQNIESALVRLSKLAINNQSIVDEYLNLIRKDIYNDKNEILLNKFLELSKSLQSQVIYDFLAQNGIEVEFKKIEEIKQFISESSRLTSGNTHSVSENCLLFVSKKIIKLISEKPQNVVKSIIKVETSGKTLLEDFGKVVEFVEWKGDEPIRYPKETDNEIYVDLSDIQKPLYIRTRLDGDRMQPFGMQQTTKLKKYLINRGIPEYARDQLMLLTTDEEILWVIGVGASEKIRVKGKPTHIIRIAQK